MGLLDFLFKSKKSTPSQEIINKYENLKRETDAIRAKNKAWSIEFNKIGELRQEAQQLEKNNKFNEAISIYLKSIEQGENSDRLNIYNYAFDIDRVIILYGKIKYNKKLQTFLEEKINKYPDYRNVRDWAVRLSKLNNHKPKKNTALKPTDILTQKPSNPTIGKKIDDFKKNMPEFNFYYDMLENGDTLNYNSNVPFELFKKLGEYKEAFKNIKSLAKIAENEGNYKTAIEAYEKMIIEEYEGVEPHERLIILYSKLKWKEKEGRAIERAILFFTQLKEKQLNYVLSLAKKYGMEKKALEYINQDKKIFYYRGAYELYNPQISRLKKWNSRLEKLKKA